MTTETPFSWVVARFCPSRVADGVERPKVRRWGRRSEPTILAFDGPDHGDDVHALGAPRPSLHDT